jgi:hypothetical protein
MATLVVDVISRRTGHAAGTQALPAQSRRREGDQWQTERHVYRVRRVSEHARALATATTQRLDPVER